jgi:predicted peptidase
MKLLITFLLLCGAAFGQPYTSTIKILPNSNYTVPAVIFQSSTAKGLPLVLFLHGMGEAGTDPNKLYSTGLPMVLKNGFRPPFDIVMVAPQRSSYSVDPAWIPYIINDMYLRFGIDTNRIYITGLSAGGWGTYGSQFNISESFAKKIAAIVPISAATQDINKTRFNWASAPTWAIVGGNDISYKEQNIDMVAKINAAKPGLAKITIRAGIGHTGWNEIYNATWKDNGVSIWDFLNGKTIAPVVVVPPAPVPPAKTMVWEAKDYRLKVHTIIWSDNTVSQTNF